VYASGASKLSAWKSKPKFLVLFSSSVVKSASSAVASARLAVTSLSLASVSARDGKRRICLPSRSYSSF
jgi:hypothetical protein